MAPTKGKKRVTKVRAPINFADVSFGTVQPGFEMRMARPTRGVRDVEQQQLDQLVMVAWQAWDDANRPEAWDDTPGQIVTVPTKMEKIKVTQKVKDAKGKVVKNADGSDKTEEVEKEVDSILDTVMWRIRRAGLHYSFKIRFGDITRENGFSQVVFIATDKSGEADESEEDDDEEEARDAEASEQDETPNLAGDSAESLKSRTDEDKPAWA